MLWLLFLPLRALLALRCSHCDLALENLALRHQLQVVLRTNPRPRLRNSDRVFWVWLHHLWPGGWREHLSLVRPETVIGWHRRGGGSTGPGGRAAAAAGFAFEPRSAS
jgi:putative transposase